MQVSLLEWKSIPKNSLRGFATIRLGKSMKIKDVSVHCSHGKRWASMPSKAMVNADGIAQRDDKGKIKYIPLIEWLDRSVSDDFSNSVVEAIEAMHPGETSSEYRGG